jgi:hypothetical protein
MSSSSAASAGAGKAAPEPPLLTHKDKALHSIALLKTLKEGGVDAVGVYIDQLEVKVQMLKKLKQWLGLSHEVVENLMDRPFYDRQMTRGKPYYAKDMCIDKDIIGALLPFPDELAWIDDRIDTDDIGSLCRAFGTSVETPNLSVFDKDNFSAAGKFFFAESLYRALDPKGLISGGTVAFLVYNDDDNTAEPLTMENLEALAAPNRYVITPMTGGEHNCVKLIGVNDKTGLVVGTYAAARGKVSTDVPMVKAHALFTGSLIMASLKFGKVVKSLVDDFSHLPHEMVVLAGQRYTVALTHVEAKGDNAAREQTCAKKQREAFKAKTPLPGCTCHRAVKCCWLQHTTYYG